MDLTDLLIGLAGHAAIEKLGKQLVVPQKDFPIVVALAKERLKANKADPHLLNFSDAQYISLAKAFDQALIQYVEARLGVA